MRWDLSKQDKKASDLADVRDSCLFCVQRLVMRLYTGLSLQFARLCEHSDAWWWRCAFIMISLLIARFLNVLLLLCRQGRPWLQKWRNKHCLRTRQRCTEPIRIWYMMYLWTNNDPSSFLSKDGTDRSWTAAYLSKAALPSEASSSVAVPLVFHFLQFLQPPSQASSGAALMRLHTLPPPAIGLIYCLSRCSWYSRQEIQLPMQIPWHWSYTNLVDNLGGPSTFHLLS